MKKKHFLAFFILFFAISNLVYSGDNLKIEILNLQESYQVNQENEIQIKFSNIGESSIEIDSILFVNPNLFLKTKFDISNFVINNSESKTIVLKFTATQNLVFYPQFYIYFKNEELKQSFTDYFKLNFVMKYNDLYDSFTQNINGLELKNALKFYVANHKSYSYKDARTYMFGSFDNVDGWVECVYTGEKIQTDGIPDVNTTHFNNEHTWPQSKGADNEPEKSDIFHMYPTNEYANSKRGDYPFGNVVSNITWQVGNSKLGNDKDGNIRFEPRDVHKGNVARSMFYFSIRYNNPYTYLNSQEETLRKWMVLDEVDSKEMKRNNDIAFIQGKRNPFIDHPEFLDRIFSISTNTDFPQVFSTSISQSQVDISTIVLEKKISYEFFITNTGNSSISITNVQIENPDNDRIIESVTPVNNYLLPKDSTLTLELTFFDNSTSQNQNSILIINTEKGEHYEIPFKEKYYNSVSNKEPDFEYLISPNPTSDKLTLSKIPEGELNYEILDYLGTKVQSGYLSKEIEVSSLKLGFYFLKINNNPPKKFIKI